jgi:hypothetical protein
LEVVSFFLVTFAAYANHHSFARCKRKRESARNVSMTLPSLPPAATISTRLCSKAVGVLDDVRQESDSRTLQRDG